MKNCFQSSAGVRASGWIRLPHVVAAILLGGLATVSQATIVFQDNFTGTAGSLPNTSIWDTNMPAVFLPVTEGLLDGAGNVAVSPIPSGVFALSSYNTTPGTGTIRLTVDFTSNETHGSIFGLHDMGNNGIMLRNDGASGSGSLNWELFVNQAGSYTYYNTGISLSATSGNTGTWVITWTAANATVSLDGTPVVDTLSTAPYSGAGALPAVALRPFVFNYHGAGSRVDSMLFESIPEPSLVALCAVGGLVLWRRRRNHRAA